MGWLNEFLPGREPRTPRLTDDFPTELRVGGPALLYTGPGSNGLEVLCCEAASRPTAASVRRAHRVRTGNRASPVLIAVGYPADAAEKVVICGPDGDQPPVHHDIESSVAGRICAAALDEPDRHAAGRLLRTILGELDGQPLPGVRNQGLFATHVLRRDLPARPDWADATKAANPMLAKRGRELVQALGYTVEALASGASMLTADGLSHAVAVFCAETDTFESPSSHFNGSSPVAHAFALADKSRVPWVIATRGAQIRLYAARPDTGVGRKGRAETYLELNLALLPADSAGYLTLNFSPAALSPEGAVTETLDASERYAADLAVRLRERVYDHTVPALASAVAARMAPNPTGDDLKAAYEQVMTILFRLLFVAYAEDKGLLPVAANSRYATHSLTKITEQIIDARNAGQLPDADTEACHWWDDIAQLWQVVDRGKEAWGVPAYNGGLFSSDPDISPAGAALDDIRISDAELEPALEALLIDDTPEGIGPVDFRSLSVREFGTIYEGLLESHMVAAQTDLAEEGARHYRPAKPGEPVAIGAGQVYFSHRSGVRKTTGSYFTPAFAVEHLLKQALGPALDAHIARLDELRESGDEAKLAEAFFDFRCADIAMGSGHFLTAALDRIEARLQDWLATYPVPGVSTELARLRQTAKNALANTDADFEVDDSALLRRQVARRCIYGADINLVAVELARLAVWIHTFVPGLPLSFLDHNLVCGDSLVGVGTLDEAMGAFEAGTKGKSGTPSMFLEAKMEQVRPILSRLALTADADAAEIADSRQAHADALASLRDAGVIDLFNVITAHRAGLIDLPDISDAAAITARATRQDVIERIAELNPLHFPAVFSEVFLRDRPGFDCLIGNPPWEKVVVADKVWWGQHLPGIRSLAIQDMKSQIAELRRERPDLDDEYKQADSVAGLLRSLLRATFPDMGSGDTDLSKAFSWRNWHLTREGGYSGLVLPRTIIRGKGSEKWRKEIFDHGTFADVTTLSNRGGWVFEDVDVRYGVALATLKRTRDSIRTVNLAGPFTNKEEFTKSTCDPDAEDGDGGGPEASKEESTKVSSELDAGGGDGGGPEANKEESTKVTSEPIPLDEFVGWSDDAAFPDLPAHPGSLKLFRRLRQSPAVKDLSLSLSLSLSRRLVLVRLDRYERSMFITTRIFSSSTRESQPCCRDPRHSEPRVAHLRQRNLSDELGQRQLACLRRTRYLPLEPRH